MITEHVSRGHAAPPVFGSCIMLASQACKMRTCRPLVMSLDWILVEIKDLCLFSAVFVRWPSLSCAAVITIMLCMSRVCVIPGGNVAVLYFYAASPPTRQSNIHFFHEENIWYMLNCSDIANWNIRVGCWKFLLIPLLKQFCRDGWAWNDCMDGWDGRSGDVWDTGQRRAVIEITWVATGGHRCNLCLRTGLYSQLLLPGSTFWATHCSEAWYRPMLNTFCTTR